MANKKSIRELKILIKRTVAENIEEDKLKEEFVNNDFFKQDAVELKQLLEEFFQNFEYRNSSEISPS